MPSNFFLLCDLCHIEQPDSADRDVQESWLFNHTDHAARYNEMFKMLNKLNDELKSFIMDRVSYESSIFPYDINNFPIFLETITRIEIEKINNTNSDKCCNCENLRNKQNTSNFNNDYEYFKYNHHYCNDCNYKIYQYNLNIDKKREEYCKVMDKLGWPE